MYYVILTIGIILLIVIGFVLFYITVITVKKDKRSINNDTSNIADDTLTENNSNLIIPKLGKQIQQKEYPKYVEDAIKYITSFDCRNPIWYINENYNIEGEETPSNMMWRSEDIMDAIDQGTCGNCWAFSVTSTISDRYRIENTRNTINYLNVNELRFPIWYKTKDYIINIKTIEPTHLEGYSKTLNMISPFEIGSCSEKKPCDGGYPLDALTFMGKNGTNKTLYDGNDNNSNSINNVNNTEFTFDPKEHKCMRRNKNNSIIPKYKVKNYIIPYNPNNKNINKMIHLYKCELYHRGPFPVGISYFPELGSHIQKYKGSKPFHISDLNVKLGDIKSKYEGAHSLSLVGFGKDFWILRDSYGQSWGDNGCHLMSFEVAEKLGMYGNISKIGNKSYLHQSVIPLI